MPPIVRTILAELDAELSQLDRPNVPSLRRVRRTLSRKLANSPPTTVLAVADALVRRSGFADRMIAYELVAGPATGPDAECLQGSGGRPRRHGGEGPIVGAA